MEEAINWVNPQARDLNLLVARQRSSLESSHQGVVSDEAVGP